MIRSIEKIFIVICLCLVSLAFFSGCSKEKKSGNAKVEPVFKSFGISEGLLHEQINSMANLNGVLWVATKKGCAVYDSQTDAFIPPGADSRVHLGEGKSVRRIKVYDGVLYMTTSTGLVSYSPGEGKWRKWTSAGDIKDVASDKGKTWVSRIWGLGVYDGASWTDLNSKVNKSIVGDDVNCMEIISGELWIGTNTGIGVMKGGATWQQITGYHKIVQGSMYVKVPGNSELVSNRVLSMAADKGSVWIGTNLGLSQRSGSNWTTYVSDHQEISQTGEYKMVSGNSPLVGSTINDIFIDGSGRRYFSTTTGLSIMTPDGNWESITPDNSPLPDRNVTCAIVIGETLWIGTKSGLLMRKMPAPEKKGSR
ncbi:MAG: hypothetical protein CVV64_03085 [Candidatus Wallbacteria bacterium HGW-Wallbacteria-1]|jgi:ligand-binding sensor domain-containing protein|uniref:Photosynthesis system II assembly factor Ycf48/Hcf136-like domain-containing protein n=1 Tax=Candidatus Wallbacteria bacterium HGW-Wallbacteria-1 TaxID=2013854 RepID=A0A2N1PTJ3_9BACT|nr:MAG: hypothetical protein CVV64_03085 [Candidatus Wallbacteria bacterium HGW-Wallbacteria-1]